ncbi:MAG TPA: crossover junction endodeoxyribonuclease RuvC [Candidatus Limnocylindrales bacterium]
MIVLGIDPGTAALGYGILDRRGIHLRAVDYGVLGTPPDLSLPERLLAVHSFVSDLIELHAPQVIGVERLFFSKNVQTAFAVGQARGVVLLAAAQHALPVREATPSEVKSAIAGYGAADKGQVGRMLQLVLDLPTPPTPDDAADALAVAVWTANTERLGERVGDRRGSPLLDRSAVAPLEPGDSPFERAVSEALALEKRSRRTVERPTTEAARQRAEREPRRVADARLADARAADARPARRRAS